MIVVYCKTEWIYSNVHIFYPARERTAGQPKSVFLHIPKRHPTIGELVLIAG